MYTSISLDEIIGDIHVLDNIIVSDHKPISFSLNCEACMCAGTDTDRLDAVVSWLPNWQQCDEYSVTNYRLRLDNLLQEVHVPWYLLSDLHVVHCSPADIIDTFYHDVIACITTAVYDTIPVRKSTYSQFNVPGWNTFVREKHDLAREAYIHWKSLGKPKTGTFFDNMKRTRALFKLALRYCKNHVEEMKADACADTLTDKDCRKFWKYVYKISNNKATGHVTNIGDISGHDKIANMWKNHFESLYSTKTASKFRCVFETRLMNCSTKSTDLLFSIQDVIGAVSKQKKCKAAGPDGLQMEAFLYGCHRLYIYCTILFNIFVKFSYVPDEFCRSVIIPLVKNKNGNLTDVNNYRAITISNSITKLMEEVLMKFLDSVYDADEYQFGFKKGLSTGGCTYAFKQTVQYYRQRGSHVFCCFIDFTKAFDYVDYWLLFCKLLDYNESQACLITVRLLAYWYSHQQVFVRWLSCHSDCFTVSNGVRQGGVLSPLLFRVYVRDLISTVVNSKIGCFIAGVCVNLLAYADDIVLLSPSWHGLQMLLNIIEDAAKAVDMSFNTDKTVCMVADPYDKRKIVSYAFPCFKLANSDLKFVSQFKYLGHIIDNSFCDDSDINRELKCLFGRVNILIRRFSRCSLQVKLKLFKS